MNEATKTEGQAAEAAAGEKAAPAAKGPANIVRGVMPILLVHVARFHYKDMKEGDLAKMLGTTTGKIADIRKGRNFAYVTEDFKPTADDKARAITWLKQVPGYDDVKTDEVVVLVDKMKVATEAETAAYTAARTGSRAKRTTAAPADGAKADNAKATGAAAPAAKGGKTEPAKAASKAEVADLLK